MCVVISGEAQPDTTKLMNIPVIIDDSKYNLFIYLNNFDLNKDNYSSQPNDITNDRFFMNNFNRMNLNDNYSNNSDSFGNFASFVSNDEFYKHSKSNKSNNSIMVVPFPVESNTKITEIGLVDITTDSMKKLRRDIKSLKPVESQTLGMTNYSRSFSAKSVPLQVHRIGNYNISIAFNMSDLVNRIDWDKFNKPSDYEKRLNTFKNTNLYPTNFKYFYVVAEAVENIKDDGFGVVYPQLNNYFYIPTAHEDNASEHNFDVEIYNFGYGKTDSNKKVYHKALESLQNQRVKMLNNTYKKMSYDKDISSFVFKEESGFMRNHNLFYRKI